MVLIKILNMDMLDFTFYCFQLNHFLFCSAVKLNPFKIKSYLQIYDIHEDGFSAWFQWLQCV